MGYPVLLLPGVVPGVSPRGGGQEARKSRDPWQVPHPSFSQTFPAQLEWAKMGRKEPKSSILGLRGWAVTPACEASTWTPPNPALSRGRPNSSPWICFSLSKGEVLWRRPAASCPATLGSLGAESIQCQVLVLIPGRTKWPPWLSRKVLEV